MRLLIRKSLARGFTLIEILIVVMILGILAAIVLPQFASASGDSRQAALADQLRVIRGQIDLYRAQHEARWPGSNAATPSGSADLFVDHLTIYSNGAGETSATSSAVYRYGGYLPSAPANPLSGLKTVLIDAAASGTPTPDGTTGWIYQPATGRLFVNTIGQDGNGKAYIDY